MQSWAQIFGNASDVNSRPYFTNTTNEDEIRLLTLAYLL